jgi:hypothetical protein
MNKVFSRPAHTSTGSSYVRCEVIVGVGESPHKDYTNYSNGLSGRALWEVAYRAFSLFAGYEGFKSV